jgi:hypothetical protein
MLSCTSSLPSSPVVRRNACLSYVSVIGVYEHRSLHFLTIWTPEFLGLNPGVTPTFCITKFDQARSALDCILKNLTSRKDFSI